jgi:glycerol uptake facilitator-like aquaporin
MTTRHATSLTNGEIVEENDLGSPMTAPKGFAGLSIGLTLALIHLISIPISNTSVNPARSTDVAFFNGDDALENRATT